MPGSPQANEVFAVMSNSEKERLAGKGAMFFDWHTPQFYRGELAGGEGDLAASSPASRPPPTTSTRSAI